MSVVLLCGFGQSSQLLVPIGFERVGDEPVLGVDHHESLARQLRLVFDRLHVPGPQPVGLQHPLLELPAHLQRQLDRGGRDDLADERTHGCVDRRAGSRLTGRIAPISRGLPAHVPCVVASPTRLVPHLHPTTAPATHAPVLQQGGILAGRLTGGVVAIGVAGEDRRVLLVMLPADVTGMGVGNAGDPVAALAMRHHRAALCRTPVLQRPYA
jgi:hypothetical protein